jgi:hypothetical protein
MMFMALLANVDPDERWLATASRMADFVESQVLPEHRWYDYETFFSCSKQASDPRDPRTGVLPQNSQSKWWAAEGMRLLAELTGDARHLVLLNRCLEDLIWHQQVWNAPYLSIDTFGGFGSMNTDGEWNDARQGCIAPVLMDSYLLTGDPHHFERGVAALRACYTTMLHPAMRAVAPGNMARYREQDRGAIYENYAHLGFDRLCAGYLEPDWGAGTAAWATAHAANFYGEIFIDLHGRQVFGIDGWHVPDWSHVDSPGDALPGGRVELTIEDRIERAPRDSIAVSVRQSAKEQPRIVTASLTPFGPTTAARTYHARITL